MTAIRIKIIPDGMAQLPVEARDHSVLCDKLKNANVTETPAPDWDSIVKSVPGNGTELELRVDDATLSDYNETALDTYASEVSSLNGVKQHPNGWEEVERDDS